MSAEPFPPPGYPPPPTPLAARLFERYLRRLTGRHFAGVHWARSGAPDRWTPDPPTIFIANHTNWWDGFLAYLVTRQLDLDFQVLMESRHLQRYRVFLKVGALPLRRDRPHAAYADLRAAVAYLRPKSGLWVFPQGERRPAAEPVAGCERGAAYLAQRFGAPVRFCPVAFRYAYLGEQLPEAFALVGDAWIHRPAGTGRQARGSLMSAVEGRLAATVEALDGLLRREQLGAFEPLVKGRLSVNKRLDRLRHAAGLLSGRFEARNG